MNIPIWLDRYCTDSKLKYPSERTQENYQSSVKSFLYNFKDAKEPSRISTQDIKEWLCTFETINTRNHKLCGVKSFYEITVGMPLKLDKIPFSKKDKKLPIVLSVDEVQSMFKAWDNLFRKDYYNKPYKTYHVCTEKVFYWLWFRLTLKIENEFLSELNQEYTFYDMLQASKYGYEFRDTTSFPEHKFEDSCINNTKQWLEWYNNKQD